MRPDKKDQNPYTVLGVERDATNRKLDTIEILDELSAEAKDQPAPKSRIGASFGRRVTLAVLLVALAVSLFLALSGKDAVCPRCEHSSVVGQQLRDGRVLFSCNCGDCDFSYSYDAEADVDEHENDRVEQARVTG